MKIIIYYLLAFVGGVFLAIQACFNTQLGSLTKQPLIATLSTSISSAVLVSVFIFFSNQKTTVNFSVQQIPTHLWFIGGFFSMLGITLYFYTIPKLGISRMITLGLCGQIIFSLIAGKFGWLDLPTEPITLKRLLGAIIMIIGVTLLNLK